MQLLNTYQSLGPDGKHPRLLGFANEYSEPLVMFLPLKSNEKKFSAIKEKEKIRNVISILNPSIKR